ncbi:MAG: glycosyltransferase [Candidatus Micrarchaeota archaeon]|nr:glycosyltransferase [Candidatus Micrarchaeota archaeon]
MADSLGGVVPAGKMVPMAITAIIPTLGRSTLEVAVKSLQEQTEAPVLIIKNGDEDTLIKIKEAVDEAKTELVAIADDDAQYPKDWIANLSKSFSPKVGFVGGPCLPLLDESSTDAERCIAEVTASFWGTSNMSYRFKGKGKTRDADETNLIGNGLYRREVFKKLLDEEYDKIPPAAWETYIFTRIRQLGYRTVFDPGGKFYHKQRTNIFSFAKQIFRSGTGRVVFFKRFPKQIPLKFYIFFPMLFDIYLFLFFLLAYLNMPISGLPLVAYVAFVMLISYGFNHHKSKWLPFYYTAMHLSYGLGLIIGFFKSSRTWD